MYTAKALMDIHSRGHRSFAKLLEHCAGFTSEELHREISGFGYSSLQLQIYHTIGAEEYWVGVLRGKMLADERQEEFPTVESLEQYRSEVSATTRYYLENASRNELNASREMITWGDNRRELVPAHVIMRTLTHIYHHQGQCVAMCRILGRPTEPGLDFPIT